MTRELKMFGIETPDYDRTADVYSGLYEGLMYVWPGRVIRKLAGAPFACDVYDLFDDKYCVDGYMIAARRGVM